MISIEIIEGIRRQVTLIKSLINHLQSLRTLSLEQAKLVEQARKSFSFIQSQRLSELRKALGDENCYKLEDIDLMKADKSWPIVPKEIVDNIRLETSELQLQLFCKLGDCKYESVRAVAERMADAVNFWRNSDLINMKKVFK